METETLYALKGHTYDMRWREPGEPYEVRRRHSGVLIALKRASRTPPEFVDVPKIPLKRAETALPSPPASEAAPADTITPEDDRDALRAEYKALFGKSAHGRTSAETLRAEIDRKKQEASENADV